MTKTQTQLLEFARARNGRYSIATCHGRGSHGGRVTHGARARDALFALEEQGLVTITSRQPWEEYNRGYKQSGNVIAFELTAKAA